MSEIKKKSRSTVAICFFLLFLFSSCTHYAYKDIQILTPASEPLLFPGKKLTILQNSYQNNNDSLRALIIDTIHRYTLEGLYFSLYDYQGIDFTIDSALKIRVDQEKRILASQWQQLDSICRLTECDIMLILDASDYYTKTDFFFNEMGYAEAFLDIMIASRWIFIEPAFHRVVKEEIFIDTLSYVEYGFLIQPTIQKLPDFEDVIAEVSWETGRIFSKKYVPTWQTRGRLYYEVPGKKFTAAIEALQKEDYTTAATIFQKYTENRNDRVAALAMYNMAVVCELEGKYTLALEWLMRSVQRKKYQTTLDYMNVIKQRIADREVLLKR
ncbi:MAG: DUF6340 family protein [Bacteroidales bacterium]|nr:tetratricopeptide repeat protein [Bacteroidales bacterium]MDD3010142.1 DUF6340 family protein [Bacteroidales bacterium]MDY0286312.1 DUF6340 family protein [Bacteroidales bacterium]